MTYGIGMTVDLVFDDAKAAIRAGLAEQGFGVLSEIDMAATMQAKLGEQISPYVILGACNPKLAFRALGQEPAVGLLLPCNVVVRSVGEGTRVEFINPIVMMGPAGNENLAPVADEAAARLRAALDTLSAHAVPGEVGDGTST